jgi:hypothetical protein
VSCRDEGAPVVDVVDRCSVAGTCPPDEWFRPDVQEAVRTVQFTVSTGMSRLESVSLARSSRGACGP